MDTPSMKKDVFNRVEKLIQKHGPRLAGTEACRDAADDLYEEMKEFTDATYSEDFNVYQGAFLGWIKILVVSYILGVVFLWLKLPVISIVLALMSILILVLQFFLYLPLLDRLYPKKTGRNVYGVIEPSGEVKKQVIISGHHDSAHVFNFFIHQPKLYNLRTTGSIGLVIGLIVLSIVSIFSSAIPVLFWTINIILSLGVLLVGQMWFFTSKKATPGAGDNLVASSIALTLGKHFKAQKDVGQGLKHTRIIVASFDGEEEGLRGARAFAKAHQEQFKQVPTYGLNMDCLYDEKELFYLTSDLNDFVKLDQELANDLVKITERFGVKAKTQKQAFLTGGTDAAELAKKGVKVTTAIGMPWTNDSRSNVYHTMNDTLDKISPKVVEVILDVYQAYIIEND